MSTTLVSDPGQLFDLGAPANGQGKPVSDSGQPVDSAPQQPAQSASGEDSQDGAGVVQKNGQITKAALGEPRALYNYLVYKPSPSSSPARVWSGRQTIFYYRGDQALYGVVNRTLDEIRWMQVLSWRNDTSAAQQYAIAYTTGLTITQGSEVNAGFSLGASYEGMSIGLDYSTRTFKSTETTSSKTITLTVTVPPHSELIFYQKRY